MGGFAGLLGHAAAGFEQARQEDLQRQFTDEQGRRNLAAGLLSGIAADPNQPDHLRTGATQSLLQLAQLPMDKHFDLRKHIEPFYNLVAQHVQQLNNPPPAPPPTPVQTPAIQAGGPPQFAPSAQGGPPQMSGGQLNLPATTSSVQGPPTPPPGLYAGIPEIAQHAGILAGAQAGGQLTGQIGARRQAFGQIPGFTQEPALTQAVLEGGGSPAFLSRTLGQGQSVPGADLLSDPQMAQMAREQGVDPSKFYNVRELMGGGVSFVPTAGRGQTAAPGGGLQSNVEAASQREQNKQQIDYPYWAKKNAVQFGQRQALLNQSFQLAVNRGYLSDANKAFVDSVKDYDTSLKTMNSMDEAFKAVQANPNNQQAQVALLMAHIGMTLGVVKGARVGKAQIEDAEHSRTMFAGAASHLNFDKDGNLDWSDPIRKGTTLTPDQMKQMVELGHQRMGILHQNIGIMHDQLDPSQMGVQPIGTTLGGPPKPRSAAPPKQTDSAASTTPTHQSFAEWKKSQQKAVQ